MTNVETELALLKREVHDMKQIHVRLDTAIEKIADVSSSLKTIMSVHEEKIVRQEEALDQQERQLRDNIQELHSRITSNAKETVPSSNRSKAITLFWYAFTKSIWPDAGSKTVISAAPSSNKPVSYVLNS